MNTDNEEDAARGDCASGLDLSLAAMRNNFFGTLQEAGVNPDADDQRQPSPQHQQPQQPQPTHTDNGDDDSRNRSTGTAVVTSPPLTHPSGRTNTDLGMSGAKRYFSVGPEDDENSKGDAVAPQAAAMRLFGSPANVNQHDGMNDNRSDENRQCNDFSDPEADRTHRVTTHNEKNEDQQLQQQQQSVSELVMIKTAIEEERAILASRPPPRELTADEEQAARLRAYDEVCGTSTWDFLRETARAVVPDAVTDLVNTGADTIARTSESVIPEGVRKAADTLGSAANTASHAIEAVPRLMVSAIPEALMSDETKQMLFGDFTNTLRSFYHTNVLSMPFVFNQAGLIGGILLLSAVSFTSEYATEAFFGAKNQLRDARKVVTYGDVPRMTWGDWYPSLNMFYGITHLIGFIAFSASNTRVLLAAMGLTGGGAMAVSLIVPSVISLPLVFIKRDVDQKPYAVISSFIVFVSVICMFTYFPYNSTSDVKLWAKSASDFFVALGVTVYAFTGIGSCAPIERTMRPRRYVKCLRFAVFLSCSIMLAFGLSGFLSYGNRTCSVITVSLQAGPMKTAISALLFVASIAIIPQQTFPFCELCDRRLLGIRHVPGYWDLKPNLLRIGSLVVSALAAWIVPYYGLLLSISGALGCGTVGIVVPAALDYVRRARWGLREGRHLLWWEYLIVFGLGLYGCSVIIIGVTFGMYKMWMTIQTNAADTC